MKEDYVPPHLVKKAREIDLLTFLKTYYPEEVVRKTRTQYCTKTHHSLKMSNGFWNWFIRKSRKNRQNIYI